MPTRATGHRHAVLAGMMLLGIAPTSRAQIRRFPVLAPIAGAAGRCSVSARRGTIDGETANRTVGLHLDGKPGRDLSAVTNARGGVASFIASTSVTVGAGRYETESVTARFDVNGQILTGERRYRVFSGPGADLENARQPLTNSDAMAALQLARRLLERCVR